jgi:hypothetical protein
MAAHKSRMSANEILDVYFIENRAKLIEVAAFLDRLDRTGETAKGKSDFRYKAFLTALRILAGGKEGRAKELQMLFSDLSPEPLESAAGMKSASGAWKGVGK